MKSLFALLITFATFCLTLHADVVVVQKIEGMPMMNGNMTLKIKGNKMRSDVGTMMSTIMDFDTGDTLMLVHGQKMVMKMSGDQMKSNMDKVQASNSDKTATKVEFVPTGKSDNIAGHQADEYTVTMMGNTVHYWFAKDYPGAEAFRDAMEKMMKSTFSKMARSSVMMPETFPAGVPVKTVTDANGTTITTTLVSVTEQNIDPTIFNAPADYQEMKMPAMPQAPAAQ